MSIYDTKTDEFVGYLRTIQTIKDLPDGTRQVEPSEWALRAADLVEQARIVIKNEKQRRADLDEQIAAADKKLTELSESALVREARNEMGHECALRLKAEQRVVEVLAQLAATAKATDELRAYVGDAGRRKWGRARYGEVSRLAKAARDAVTNPFPRWAWYEIDRMKRAVENNDRRNNWR